MDTILGYWVEHATGIYFVRGAFEALPEHAAAFVSGEVVADVTITPVTRHQDIAPFVVIRHLKKGVIFYTRWSPESPVPIEHDHGGKVAYEVLDFAESIEEAEAVVKQLKSQK